MQKSRKKALMGGISLGLAALLAIGGGLAYFTDREAVTANGTAGSLNITVNNYTDLSQDQSISDNILNPGDEKNVSWQVFEDGNKSADIRTTLTLTSDKAMTDENGQMEFEIYNRDDVEEKFNAKGESMGYGPKTGATPLQTRTVSDDKKTITYTPAEYSLNGNTMSGTDAETDIADVGNSKESDYVLVFRQSSSNDFQAAMVNLNVLLEAKQHRNTKGKWGEIANEDYTINGKSVKVVPKNGSEETENKLYQFRVTNYPSYQDALTFTSADGSKTFATNQAFRAVNGSNNGESGDGVLGYYDWGGANIEPGTYTASYKMVDDFGRDLNKTANITVNIKDGLEYYDLTSQTKVPDTYTDDDGNTAKMANLTVNVKENPDGGVELNQAGLFISPKRDSSVLSRTFRVVGKNINIPETLGIVTETDAFPYTYNGTDNDQEVNYENSTNMTVNFTGTFSKLPTLTITAPSSFMYNNYSVGYFSNGSWQTTKGLWFENNGSGAAKGELTGKYGTYKLVDPENNKMYEFTFDADHTNIDLSTITPVDTALTLNNTASIPSGTSTDLEINSSDGRTVTGFSLNSLQTTDSGEKVDNTLRLSCYYNYQTGKLKDGYTAKIVYTASDGTITTKSVDLANRIINFAQ